jgi:hypothetical protein
MTPAIPMGILISRKQRLVSDVDTALSSALLKLLLWLLLLWRLLDRAIKRMVFFEKGFSHLRT